MDNRDIRFGVALYMQRDIASPSKCCPAGQICRAELRAWAEGKADPEREERKLWKRLRALGLIEQDYGRLLTLPDNVIPFGRRLQEDEYCFAAQHVPMRKPT